MSTLVKRAALPALLEALDRATSSGGASALDASVPQAVWRRALVGPAAEFLARPGKELRTSIVRAGWTLGGGATLDGVKAHVPYGAHADLVVVGTRGEITEPAAGRREG